MLDHDRKANNMTTIFGNHNHGIGDNFGNDADQAGPGSIVVVI